MRKIIAIGESILDVVFKDGNPNSSFAGGRIINLAASTATAGINTFVVSECGTDMVGNMIVDYLETHMVNTKSTDRFTDGTTALSMIFSDKTEEIRMRYGKYPADRFDVVWPRIDEDDIIVFGSFYSIDPELRLRLFELINYAVERKAIIVYLPGFNRDANYRITKVMTAILENMEVANLIIAKDTDAKNIFDNNDAKSIFKNKIAFYCPNYIQIDGNYNLSLFSSKKSLSCVNKTGEIENSLSWHSGFCAGVIYGLVINNIKHSDINSIDSDRWESIIDYGVKFASNSHSTGTNCISNSFGESLKAELDKILQDNQAL